MVTGPVIVAVVAVRMVQVTVHDVIDMIAVRHGFVTATVAMQVARFVAVAIVRHATVGILGGHFEAMLVVMALVRMVQVAVCERNQRGRCARWRCARNRGRDRGWDGRAGDVQCS